MRIREIVDYAIEGIANKLVRIDPHNIGPDRKLLIDELTYLTEWRKKNTIGQYNLTDLKKPKERKKRYEIINENNAETISQ